MHVFFPSRALSRIEARIRLNHPLQYEHPSISEQTPNHYQIESQSFSRNVDYADCRWNMLQEVLNILDNTQYDSV